VTPDIGSACPPGERPAAPCLASGLGTALRYGCHGSAAPGGSPALRHVTWRCTHAFHTTPLAATNLPRRMQATRAAQLKELAALKAEKEEVEKQLKQYAGSDPEALKELQAKVGRHHHAFAALCAL